MNRFGRRCFGVSSVGAVVGLLAARPASAARPTATVRSTNVDMPSWLIAPLGPGSRLGNGWRIAELSGVVRGGYVLKLSNKNGDHVEVHLCKLEGAARGLASTEHLDLFVMNGGDGAVPSDEQLGLVVMALARRIRANELRKGTAARPPADVLSHEARLARYFRV